MSKSLMSRVCLVCEKIIGCYIFVDKHNCSPDCLYECPPENVLKSHGICSGCSEMLKQRDEKFPMMGIA